MMASSPRQSAGRTRRLLFFQMPQEVFCAVHVGWVSNFWVMYYNAELLAYLSSCGGKEPE